MHGLSSEHGASLESGRVTVRPFVDGDAANWDELVAQCSEATFFHRIGWRAVISESFGHRCHYMVAERGNKMSGILPLCEIRSRLFGHSLVSLPFAVYGGPAAFDEQSARALITTAEELAQQLGVSHLELRNREPRCPDWPRQSLYVTFRKRIDRDPDVNMKNIPRKQRAMVRKGARAGLGCQIDTTVDRFFALYSDNVHRHGTPPFSRSYFAHLKTTFGEACEILTIVDRAGRPVSGVLSFYFRDEVLPYYAGDTLAARDLAANDFKYWQLLLRATGRGAAVFDFGRSKRGTGSYDFKSNWGFDPSPLYYEFRLLKGSSVPENNPLNPKYAALIALWRRLPRPVVNALGPKIIRNLG